VPAAPRIPPPRRGGLPSGPGDSSPRQTRRGARSLLAGLAARSLGRGLTVAGGLLLVAGAFLPWAYVPVGRMRLPLPGVLGLGGVTLLLGLWLALRPRLQPLIALPLALAVALWVPLAGDELAHQVRGGLISLQLWLAPVNRLLEQFRISGIEVVDLGQPRAAYLGPGLAVTAWGAGVAALGSLVRLFIAGEGPPRLQDRLAPHRCPACAVPIPRARSARFCPTCGASLGGPPLCPACHTPAEPNDRFCAACGVSLPS